MDLDRQEPPARTGSRPEPPQRLPEGRPPLLGDWFIYLSVVVLGCGIVAISALNFGASISDAVVRVPALVAAGLLLPLSADAAVRSWRSAWAWLPIDRPRGLSRFVWTFVLLGVFAASIALILFLANA